MAKRIIDWTEINGVLNLNRYDADKDAEAVVLHEFNIVDLYPDFQTYNMVQRHVIVYGLKQKLADAEASEIGDEQGMVDKAVEQWGYFLEDKLHGERANSTGAADNKKAANVLKTTAKIVSLQGLIAKQLLSQIDPAVVFTSEDQDKLNEFMAMTVKANKK